MNIKERTKNFEYGLTITVVLLFLIGIVLLMSATHYSEYKALGDYKKVIIQTITFLIGIGILCFNNIFDYTRVRKYCKKIYVFCIFLLLIVWIPKIGSPQFGAHSWVNIFGVFNLQTSEIVKPLFILCYATYLEDKKGHIQDFGDLGKAILFAVPIVGLVLIQPDLGGAIVFLSIMFGMLFISGMDVKLILYAGVIFALCFPLVYKFGLRPHQVERLDAYFTLLFHPSNLSEIYKNNLQVAQSMTAIGSGGALGKGWLRGTYSQYGFIFVSESDFIFSVAGEEFGFVGMSIIICLYIYFLLRLLTISILSKDFYGKLIGIGVFSLFFYQVVQNIGMTIGIIPVTGLPLPFVSYGGSSMISSMMCVALSLNVAKNKRKFDI